MHATSIDSRDYQCLAERLFFSSFEHIRTHTPWHTIMAHTKHASLCPPPRFQSFHCFFLPLSFFLSMTHTHTNTHTLSYTHTHTHTCIYICRHIQKWLNSHTRLVFPNHGSSSCSFGLLVEKVLFVRCLYNPFAH